MWDYGEILVFNEEKELQRDHIKLLNWVATEIIEQKLINGTYESRKLIKTD